MDSESEEEVVEKKEQRARLIYKYLKMAALLLWWFFFTISMIMKPLKRNDRRMISVSAQDPFKLTMKGDMLPHQGLCGVIVKGPVMRDTRRRVTAKSTLEVKIETVRTRADNFILVRNTWEINLLDVLDPEVTNQVKRAFELPTNALELELKIAPVGTTDTIPLELLLIPDMVSSRRSIIIGMILLISLYLLLIWDIVDRVFAALLSATTAIGVLAWFNERPGISLIVGWIDLPTIVLLFGIMVLVAILSDTGLFDLVAIYTYRISRGNAWPMIYALCTIVTFSSAFLDSVTIILLMTPVTIRLCEIMNLHVINVLIIMIVFANIGGAATPVGNPPNVIITNNETCKAEGVRFLNFTLHLFPVTFLCFIVALIQIRFQLGDKGIRAPPEDEQQKIERELKAWEHARRSVGYLSSREQAAAMAMNEKIKALKDKYKKTAENAKFNLKATPSYADNLSQMMAQHPIKNKPLLIKSLIVLVFAILMFFLHALPLFEGIPLEWTAILAALLLLILSCTDDITSIIERIEWSTLLFLAALFVVMEALAELGLIEWIGLQTMTLIGGVSSDGRLALAIFLFLWISGITSAFVDNIPTTQMMIKVCVLIFQAQPNLSLQPLAWSLVLGACFGGNGTIIGASTNIVCAGLAAQHGYKFSFFQFFKIAFPVTITTLCIATIYLMICHIGFQWNG